MRNKFGKTVRLRRTACLKNSFGRFENLEYANACLSAQLKCQMLQKLLHLCFIGLFSCSTTDTSTKNQDNTSAELIKKVEADTTHRITGTVNSFSVDDYPITDEILDDKTSDNSSYEKVSGDVHSYDKAWFTNDVLKQTLVFELYTDKHRLITFHCNNNDIPDAVIDQMELHVNGHLATFAQKKKSFNGFINAATKIDKKYFTTYKGFKLGDSKDKALKLYGKPDSVSINSGVEKIYWDFFGDVELHDGSFHPTARPMAANSFGHQITMFFRKNKLIGVIFHNDIP